MIVTVMIIGGIIAIGGLGLASRRRQKSMSNWTVGERSNPKWTSWFLQAGESLTTFSYLGLAGIAFAGGVSSTFAIAYLTISWLGLYFVTPRIRELGQRRGYLTMGDFFEDRFRSRWLGRVVALIGALALIPYLQLQITGLGLIVELATGSTSARGLSMVIASILVAIFVAWSGIKGIARVAILKDILMVVAMVVIATGLAISFNGIPGIFARIATEAPTLLTMQVDGYDPVFFVTATLVTVIGSSFNTLPHLWPPVLAAKSGEVLRSNAKWLPIYQLVLFLPITVGLAAVLVLPEGTTGNTVLLTMSGEILPDWLVGVVAIAGASAAMVPASAIVMGISTLITRNVIGTLRPARQMTVNYLVIVVAIGLALAFGLVRSDIGALLLLTYGCTTQFAPAVAIALARRVRVGAWPVGLSIITGSLTVAVITFAEIPLGSWDSGLIALAPNLLVLVIAEAVRRARGGGDVTQVAIEPAAHLQATTH
ncbi:sodium:solute symporter family protein [Pseudoclavibacter sp. VKM Ac-2867]|uniref:sodium:solute symporter family protein n=1 Tax=Pseudoclavibacter sp. VKM Ac-2867 TaxID=2783829 RepID=UPI00188D5E20|nr:sodium:solute symporter family protein [Pseudoclavibacter sp. VKM Ac-2867]MBF4457934.1 sodium:solute symporter family protein [Pseudoclavibacter sp. VKM Ac-2867]